LKNQRKFQKKIGNKINLFENNNEKIESNDKKKILNFVKICQTKLPPKMISIYLDILIISFKKKNKIYLYIIIKIKKS